MATNATTSSVEPSPDPAVQLDVLGDECARTILVSTSDGPKTARELTKRTSRSSATVYRRINNLIDAGLLGECVRFDEGGSHTTAYEARIDRLEITVDADGIEVVRSLEDD